MFKKLQNIVQTMHLSRCIGHPYVLLDQTSHPPPFLAVVAKESSGLGEEVLPDGVPVVHPEVEDHLDRVLAVLGEEKLHALRIHDVHATRQAWNVEDEDRAVLFEAILTNLIDLQFQTRVFPDFPKELPKTWSWHTGQRLGFCISKLTSFLLR